MATVSIGVRELRQHASRYVRMVKEGHRVAVTERGTLVAYLVPPEQQPPGMLERLEARGELTPAVGSVLDLLPPPPLPEGQRPLSEVLQELRDEERG